MRRDSVNTIIKMVLLCSVIVLAALTSVAQTQTGYVKTRGRLDKNGNNIPGQRISGATVQVKGRNAVATNANGAFSFPIPAKSFVVQSVKKNGYTLVDPEATLRQYDYSSNPLIFVLETPTQITVDKLDNERKIRRTLERRLHEKEDEIETLKEQNRITQEEYQKALQQLYAEQESNEKLIRDMVDRYSQIDYDQLDEFNQRISDCILNGRLTEADSLLRSKGGIMSRIAIHKRNEIILATEEIELAQRNEIFNQAKASVTAEKEDIAQDCKRYYEAFLMDNQIDSAFYYIEQLLVLDSTNIEWLTIAGSFANNYLKNSSLALDYSLLGLRQANTLYGDDNDHVDVATLFGNIGTIYSVQGDFPKALEFYEKALTINEKILGEEHPSIATLYNNIGWIYYNQFDYLKALDYMQKALVINEHVLGSEHPTVAMIYNNIGSIYKDQGENAKALECFQKALDINEKCFDKKHPSLAVNYYNIGNIYQSQGDNENAVKCYQEALDINEQILGTEHPDVGKLHNRIGYIYQAQGENAKALEHYQKALVICERVLSSNHPLILSVKERIESISHITIGN